MNPRCRSNLKNNSAPLWLGIVGSGTWGNMFNKLNAATRINGTGNGSPTSTGSYYGHKVYQRASGTYTNTYFFRQYFYNANAWDVYLAAPGSQPGSWSVVV